MRRIFRGYVPTIAAIVLTCIVAGGVIGMLTEQRVWGAVAASWAQALGALVALGVAFAVPEWTKRKAIEEADDAVFTHAIVVWIVIHGLLVDVRSVKNKMPPLSRLRSMRRVLQGQAAPMRILTAAHGSQSTTQLVGFILLEVTDSALEALDDFLADESSVLGWQALRQQLEEAERELARGLDAVETSEPRKRVKWREFGVLLGAEDANEYMVPPRG